ncbi:MAG: mismatch-specific DNA-glycosylase [Thermincola sp.]|jgi:TDG/mug DNA glycosylase family protein|nr:mismatch-specific DNA-glycosylase [Thermincola sp.]MDT3704336.1 mismatch-specific DNA-glycosylase [Thermincola sp.]
MWVSPKSQDTDFAWPLSLEDKITIFLERTSGWQLDIADHCINGKRNSKGELLADPIEQSGFAVLHIVLSYFEMVAKYQEGFMTNGKSEHFFKKGVYSVFPHLKTVSSSMVDNLLNILYFGARCGLYHGGMTDHRIVITSETPYPLILEMSKPQLKINPHLLVPALKMHLWEYGAQLRNPGNEVMRRNFEKRFDFDALKYGNCEIKKLGHQYVSADSSKVSPKSAQWDIFHPNLDVVFCGIANWKKEFSWGSYYPDNRNRFWSVLHRVGLTPRQLASHEGKTLPSFGIGLTTLIKGPSPQSRTDDIREWTFHGLTQKIEQLKPKTVAFNGKHAAQEFFGCPVHYGRQAETVGSTNIFVLPSTSGMARKYWNEEYWRELAEYVRGDVK